MYSGGTMSLQAVRALYEVPVMNACATYVPVVAENQAYTGGSSSKEECRMMSFGDITVQTLGESLETLNGTFVVELFGEGRRQAALSS